jgi:hypothetical protein
MCGCSAGRQSLYSLVAWPTSDGGMRLTLDVAEASAAERDDPSDIEESLAPYR